MNVADVLSNCVRRYPEKLAFVFEDTRLTYRAFNERCNRLANALSGLGVGKGAHFALLSKNSHQCFEMFFAAAKTGAVFVPLNYRLSPRELIYILNDSESRVLFIAKEYETTVRDIEKDLKDVRTIISIDAPLAGMGFYEELLSRAQSSEPDSSGIDEKDLIGIFYTSGTTGYPKGAMVSHKNRIIDMIHQATDFEYVEPEDTYLSIGPLFHIGILGLALAHIYMGCTVVILKEFDAKKIFESIERENIRNFWAAPTMVHMLLDYPEGKKYNLSSLKTIAYSSSPMPMEIMKKAMDFFGPNLFVQFFGSTETGPQVTHLSRKDHVLSGTEKQLRRLRSVGVESQMVHARIVDDEDQDVAAGQVGEIIVKSDAVTQGYWKNPEETRKAIKEGWYHTGDLGYMDEDRYIYIVDRKKDMIITGGENVYSAEVENVLYMHPAIAEAAVIGVPHEKWVEAIKAIVILKPGVKAGEQEIIEFCKQNLATYKKPAYVEFVTEMPKSSMGKILKRELRELYGKQQRKERPNRNTGD